MITPKSAVSWVKSLKRDVDLTIVQRRVARIPTSELSSWADQTLTSITQSFGAWRRTDDKEHLSAAVMGTEALLAILKEMSTRSV